jgi:hypothetical protein
VFGQKWVGQVGGKDKTVLKAEDLGQFGGKLGFYVVVKKEKEQLDTVNVRLIRQKTDIFQVGARDHP